MSTFYFRDTTHFAEPLFAFVSASLKRGEWPLWNPLLYCGMPQIAVLLQNVFYPPNFLAALLPYSAGISFILISHQLIAAIGIMLLILRFGWGLWPATIAAMTLALSGFNFSLSSNFHLVETASWCPLTIWCILNIKADPLSQKEKPARQDSRTYAIRSLIASVAIAMLLLAGHPELAFTNLLIIGFVSLWEAYRDREDSNWKDDLIWRVGSIVAGGLMAMPVILPVMEWFSLSRRSEGLDPKEALLMSANFYDLLSILLWQPLGDLQLRWSEFRSLIMPEQFVPYVSSPHLGPVCLTFAVWGMLDKQWQWRFPLLMILVASLVLALGDSTPIMPALLSIFPKLSILRFPVKWIFFPLLIVAIFAARGAVALVEKRAAIKSTCVLWVMFTISAALLILWVGQKDPALHDLHGAALAGDRVFGQAVRKIADQALIAGGVGLLTATVAFFIGRTEYRTMIQALISAALLLSMLVPALSVRSNAAAGDFFQQPSLVDKQLKIEEVELGKKNTRYAGLFVERFTVPENWLSRDSQRASISTAQYSRQVLRPNCNIDFNRASSLGFEASTVGDYYHFFLNCYGDSHLAPEPKSKPNDRKLATICKATSTDFVLSQTYRYDQSGKLDRIPLLDPAMFALVYEDQANNIRAFQIPAVLPRLFFANSIVEEADYSKAIELMYENESFDPGKATIITDVSNKNDAMLSNSIAAERPIGKSNLQVMIDSANRISVQTDSEREEVLVLNDQYYPGWKAYVDGRETRILRANCFMRAIRVPAGKHLVEFAYLPISFFAGLTICALTFLLQLYKILRKSVSKQNAQSAAPGSERSDVS